MKYNSRPPPSHLLETGPKSVSIYWHILTYDTCFTSKWRYNVQNMVQITQICIKRATRRPTCARTRVWPMRKIRVSPNTCTNLGLGLSKNRSKYANCHNKLNMWSRNWHALVVPKCKSMHICVTFGVQHVNYVQITCAISGQTPCVCGFGHNNWRSLGHVLVHLLYQNAKACIFV